ncbi:unnamed protein product [Paramecium sonneborni]|uniref:Uncharacterized protein n=1 Tax=Paramecium sonneborni TaxID=65129 RepID=A0A8S1K8Z4_9CILI|nr:unnamed protein product [Paramecium sonneborni]
MKYEQQYLFSSYDVNSREIYDMNQTIQLIKGVSRIPLLMIIIVVGDEKVQTDENT